MNRTEEFRWLLKVLGLSQTQAAKELEVDDRTVRYWCSANPEPPLMAILALKYLKEADEWKDPCSDAA